MRDFQLMLLLFAVFGNIGDTAVIQEQLHLGLLILGAFVTLNKHKESSRVRCYVSEPWGKALIM